MAYWDAMSYLPDDILVKMDRASMAVSLESRIPLLDHRVIEFASALPLHFKVRDGQGKWLLRQVLNRYVPKELVERPKQGFSIPIAQWLRGPLRDWAESLLSETELDRSGCLNVAKVRNQWDEHLSGRRQWHNQLWNVLCLQGWLRENKYVR